MTRIASTPARANDSSHALVAQQRIDAWFAAAEGLEALQRAAAAAGFENLFAVAAPGVGVDTGPLSSNAL